MRLGTLLICDKTCFDHDGDIVINFIILQLSLDMPVLISDD